MTASLLSWNVNGIRAILKKEAFQFWGHYRKEHPNSIICLQETKAKPEQVDLPEELSQSHKHWNYPSHKPGYSGTAIFSNITPLRYWDGLKLGPQPISKADLIGVDKNLTPIFEKYMDHYSSTDTSDPFTYDEGRVVTFEFPKVLLLNCYAPNALNRLPYRIQWDAAFLQHINNLRKIYSKHIIVCGDLNVAHEAIDLARPEDNETEAGYTIEERTGFTALLSKGGLVDTFRYKYPALPQYSYWNYRTRAREYNIGWRVDYVCIDEALVPHLKRSFILDQIKGSDHCPVGVELDMDVFL